MSSYSKTFHIYISTLADIWRCDDNWKKSCEILVENIISLLPFYSWKLSSRARSLVWWSRIHLYLLLNLPLFPHPLDIFIFYAWKLINQTLPFSSSHLYAKANSLEVSRRCIKITLIYKNFTFPKCNKYIDILWIWDNPDISSITAIQSIYSKHKIKMKFCFKSSNGAWSLKSWLISPISQQ